MDLFGKTINGFQSVINFAKGSILNVRLCSECACDGSHCTETKSTVKSINESKSLIVYHCVKSVRIRSYSGRYFPTFGVYLLVFQEMISSTGTR